MNPERKRDAISIYCKTTWLIKPEQVFYCGLQVHHKSGRRA